MARQLRRSVVVLVGATSGPGRAAATAFADRGARLVLAARDAPAPHPLQSTVMAKAGAKLEETVAHIRNWFNNDESSPSNTP